MVNMKRIIESRENEENSKYTDDYLLSKIEESKKRLSEILGCDVHIDDNGGLGFEVDGTPMQVDENTLKCKKALKLYWNIKNLYHTIECC